MSDQQTVDPAELRRAMAVAPPPVQVDGVRADEDRGLVASVRVGGADYEVSVPADAALGMDAEELRRHLAVEALAAHGYGLHAPNAKVTRLARLAAEVATGYVAPDDEILARAKKRAPAHRAERERRAAEAAEEPPAS